MKRVQPSLWSRALARVGLQRTPKSPRQRSAFSGAQSNRLTLDWVLAPIASPDREQRADSRVLRARAREVVRNTAVGAAYMQAIDRNVVGTGIKLQAKNYTSEGVLHTRANAAIEAAWKTWSQPGVCTLDGRFSLNEVCSLALRTMKTDGEFFAEIVEGDAARNGWGIALNLLDADLLDETFDRQAGKGVNEIRSGVELDSYGRAVAYHFWEAYPGDTSSIGKRVLRRRVPAERVIHLFAARRPGNTRGTTAFAPVLLSIRMLAGYMEAELVAARVASAKMGAIQSGDGGEMDAEADEDAEPQTTQQTVEADPGTFFRLGPGETLETFDPEHPTSAFRDFTVANKQDIASGLGTSYATLSGDLSEASYGSARVGLLAERDGWELLQEFICCHFLTRVYAVWIGHALLYEKIDGLTSFDPSRWMRIEWQCRGFPWIDPLKDISADGEALALGLTNRHQLCAERGIDFDENLETLKQEQSAIAAAGVPLQTPSLGNAAVVASTESNAPDTQNAPRKPRNHLSKVS